MLRDTPKVNDRVRVKSLDIKGTITYVDMPALYVDHLYPVQVLLDKDYDESGHRMYRTNIKDLRGLRKKGDKA